MVSHEKNLINVITNFNKSRKKMITSIDAGKKNIINLVKQFYQKQTTNIRLIGKTSVTFFK